MRDVVYAGIGPARRPGIHAEIARRLEAQAAPAGVIAEQWLLAHEPDAARRSFLALVDECLAGHTYRDGVRAARHALELSAEDRVARLDALERLAGCAALDGDASEAARAWREIAESRPGGSAALRGGLARLHADQLEANLSAVAAEIYQRLADSPEHGGDYAQARATYDDAEDPGARPSSSRTSASARARRCAGVLPVGRLHCEAIGSFGALLDMWPHQARETRCRSVRMRRLADRWWLVGLTLLIGVLALTAVVFRIESDQHAQQRQAKQRAAVSGLRESIGDVLAHEVALTRVLGVLHGPIGTRWPMLANIVTSQPLAFSAGFITPVSESDRAGFEARTGLQVLQSTSPGVYSVAQRRPEYFVVTHAILKSGTAKLGLDLGVDPVRRKLLLRSAATGRQFATPPVKLLVPGAVKRGVVVFAPVRTAQGRLRGWVTATYEADQLAASVSAHSPGLRLTVRDGADFLVSTPGAVNGKPSSVEVAGRRWSVWTSVPGSGVGAVPWMVLGLGLSLTLAVVLVLRQAVARERYALGQVAWHVGLERERQAELDGERRALADAQAIAQIGSWSWVPATDQTGWSPEMYRIFDRDPVLGPATSEDFFAYLHAEDRARIADGYLRAFGAGDGFDLSYRIVAADGNTRFLYGIGRRESDGQYVGTVQDVTALRRVEDALVESERANRTLAAIVQQSNDAVIAKTVPDGVITEWNRAAERIYGHSAGEAVGQPISMLVPADRAGEERDIMRQLIAGHAIGNYETRRVRKDGTVLDVSVTISPIRDDDGLIVGASAISRDITERIALQQTLRDTEERFRGAFEEAPIGMALLDLDGRLTQVNDAVCQILGYTGDQLVGMTAASITHPDDRGADRQAWEEIRAGARRSYATEKRYLHASGHPVSCLLQATVISAADGRPSRVLAQVQDITERKRNEEQLEYLADHDALTGLLNRRAFARELASHAALATRYGAEGAVLMIDLDQFKYVNDTLGHQAGDELIVSLAELLSERLRTSDVLARLGGDEFAVLLPKAGLSAARLVAQSVLETLRGSAIIIAGTHRKITASIGIASFEHCVALSGEDALINADLALYDAKEAGRDQVAVFSPDRPAATRMKGRITWGQKITAALETDNFTLLAQPIIDLATSTVSQYELLLRMNDEHGELIPPSAFLQIAERLDLIHDVDMWVVTHGIQALADLAPEHPDIALELNLSGRSLSDQRLLEHIDAELRHARVAPERVIFEVTETAALTSVTKARAFGEHLSEIGCRFALDDFGGALGSFYYLKHLVFDYLKIDGEFIRNAAASDTDQLLIKAIVDIARGMGKQTIAEFVGDDETIRLLTRLGVDYGQGYHVGIPAPLAQHLANDANIPPTLPLAA